MNYEPWKHEKDLEMFESHGMKCVILRHDIMGHLCGYVGLPKGHPGFGADYDSSVFDSIEVHWGLTHSGDLQHVPGLQMKRLHFVGFDCAHSGDLVPGLTTHMGDVYRDMDFVKAETERLAKQLSELTDN